MTLTSFRFLLPVFLLVFHSIVIVSCHRESHDNAYSNIISNFYVEDPFFQFEKLELAEEESANGELFKEIAHSLNEDKIPAPLLVGGGTRTVNVKNARANTVVRAKSPTKRQVFSELIDAKTTPTEEKRTTETRKVPFPGDERRDIPRLPGIEDDAGFTSFHFEDKTHNSPRHLNEHNEPFNNFWEHSFGQRWFPNLHFLRSHDPFLSSEPLVFETDAATANFAHLPGNLNPRILFQ